MAIKLDGNTITTIKVGAAKCGAVYLNNELIHIDESYPTVWTTGTTGETKSWSDIPTNRTTLSTFNSNLIVLEWVINVSDYSDDDGDREGTLCFEIPLGHGYYNSSSYDDLYLAVKLKLSEESIGFNTDKLHMQPSYQLFTYQNGLANPYVALTNWTQLETYSEAAEEVRVNFMFHIKVYLDEKIEMSGNFSYGSTYGSKFFGKLDVKLKPEINKGNVITWYRTGSSEHARFSNISYKYLTR